MQLHEEAKAVLGDRDPTYDDFDSLVYAQCVFKETLRMVPPVWALGKYCSESTRLIDHNVTPAVRTAFLRNFKYLNEQLIIIFDIQIRTTMAIYSIHRNPKYWKEPERFMPSRFDTRVNPPVSAYSFIPFSLGRRSCLGNRFAMAPLAHFQLQFL
jgi:cytochrome P450